MRASLALLCFVPCALAQTPTVAPTKCDPESTMVAADAVDVYKTLNGQGQPGVFTLSNLACTLVNGGARVRCTFDVTTTLSSVDTATQDLVRNALRDLLDLQYCPNSNHRLVDFSMTTTKVTFDITNPTSAPTRAPTSPTRGPTSTPTASPTKSPTTPPTRAPTVSPTVSPTASPTVSPTASPTASPTKSPTGSPTVPPTASPTVSPTTSPTGGPTTTPTSAPTGVPTTAPSVSTASPTSATTAPTAAPSVMPSTSPTGSPAAAPSGAPTQAPTQPPSVPSPSAQPSATPSGVAPGPSASPSAAPSLNGSAPGPTASPAAAAATSPPTDPGGNAQAPAHDALVEAADAVLADNGIDQTVRQRLTAGTAAGDETALKDAIRLTLLDDSEGRLGVGLTSVQRDTLVNALAAAGISASTPPPSDDDSSGAPWWTLVVVAVVCCCVLTGTVGYTRMRMRRDSASAKPNFHEGKTQALLTNGSGAESGAADSARRERGGGIQVELADADDEGKPILQVPTKPADAPMPPPAVPLPPEPFTPSAPAAAPPEVEITAPDPEPADPEQVAPPRPSPRRAASSSPRSPIWEPPPGQGLFTTHVSGPSAGWMPPGVGGARANRGGQDLAASRLKLPMELAAETMQIRAEPMGRARGRGRVASFSLQQPLTPEAHSFYSSRQEAPAFVPQLV
eukprot:TRINITY_DN2232_c0_g2_i3.p1 TRINITY_DN2232_c0_g2~~TRINITY_DN2232_c0_g2_i3.p1  ORF type:complete len:681 (+),score=108.17 TRINITY_DN2232_c0_g2_i3:48-2090(+)